MTQKWLWLQLGSNFFFLSWKSFYLFPVKVLTHQNFNGRELKYISSHLRTAICLKDSKSRNLNQPYQTTLSNSPFKIAYSSYSFLILFIWCPSLIINSSDISLLCSFSHAMHINSGNWNDTLDIYSCCKGSMLYSARHLTRLKWLFQNHLPT